MLYLMVIRVWVDEWQMACCGDPFHVGGGVEWTLLTESGAENLPDVLDVDTVDSINYRQDHHGDAPEDAPTTRGTVRRICIVTCQFGQIVGRPREHFLVPGSGQLDEVSSSDDLERAPDGFHRPGFIVDLEPAPDAFLPGL